MHEFEFCKINLKHLWHSFVVKINIGADQILHSQLQYVYVDIVHNFATSTYGCNLTTQLMREGGLHIDC